MGNSKWLSNSLKGEVRWEGAINQIRSLCENRGLGELKITRLSGLKILISVENLKEVWPVIKHYDKEVADLFVSIGHWIPNDIGL